MLGCPPSELSPICFDSRVTTVYSLNNSFLYESSSNVAKNFPFIVFNTSANSLVSIAGKL